MTSGSQRLAGILLAASLCLPGAAVAQNNSQPWGIALSTGAVTTEDGVCRFEFGLDNHLTRDITALEVVLVARDQLGPVERTRLRLGPIAAGDHYAQEISLRPANGDCDTIQAIEVVLQSCEIGGNNRFEGCLALMRTQPGEGRPLVINRTPMPMPAEGPGDAAAPRSDEAAPTLVPMLGVTIASITESLAEKFSVSPGVEGVLVIAADPNRAAATRLMPGDVILEIDQDVVRAAEDVAQSIHRAIAANQSSLLVLTLRDGQEDFIVVPLGQ
ncbi:MAG: hypothetical protein CMM50_10415 [Rhodospirillaceae bacterium]|nr:hypothetical protein [Rhodospirillaceae bacterium]